MATRSNPPPILLFAYNRDKHLGLSWQALAENQESRKSVLHVFLDGPRNSLDRDSVHLTRKEAQKIKGFREIYYHFSEKNLGLSQSILRGIKLISTFADSWIVLEDDLVVTPDFLSYMHDGLACYRNADLVASVHGYVYPTSKKLPETFFLKGADCWGWATWQFAWSHFEADGKKLFEQIQKRKLEEEFDLGGVARFTRMLKDQIAGINDSWAIRWHASAFLAGLHTLYPGRSLVKNIGLDRSGTHCGESNRFDSYLSPGPIQVSPIPVEESQLGRTAFHEFFKTHN